MDVRRDVEILKSGRSSRTAEDAKNTKPPTPYKDSSTIQGDPTFAALAQLVALRLNAKRSFIVLDDGPECHVLAEATRTVSPYEPTHHEEGDQLMFGVQSVPIEYGIMYKTMPAYRGNKDKFVDSDVSIINNTHAIISDLQAEPVVKDLIFMKNNDFARFYAEAPLVNSKGIPIGIVAVLDDQPRSNFREVDPRPLIDVAALIVERLNSLDD